MTLKQLYQRTHAAMGIYGDDQEIRAIVYGGNYDEFNIMSLSLDEDMPLLEIMENEFVPFEIHENGACNVNRG